MSTKPVAITSACRKLDRSRRGHGRAKHASGRIVSCPDYFSRRARKMRSGNETTGRTGDVLSLHLQQTDSTALGALLRLLNAFMCPKEVEASSLFLEVQNLHTIGCWSSWKCWQVVWHEFQVWPDFDSSASASVLNYPTSLVSGTPARPSNSGDKVRFVLGVILPGGLDWWTDTKNHFYASNETYSPVRLHDASY